MTSYTSATLLGMVAVSAIAIGCGGARSSSEATITPADFRSVNVAEVRNAQDQVVLTGKFVEVASDSDDVERKAALTGTALDGDATGEAEVESCRDDCRSQEVEFSVANLAPNTVFRSCSTERIS